MDTDDRTPLFYAFVMGNVSCVRVIVTYFSAHPKNFIITQKELSLLLRSGALICPEVMRIIFDSGREQAPPIPLLLARRSLNLFLSSGRYEILDEMQKDQGEAHGSLVFISRFWFNNQIGCSESIELLSALSKSCQEAVWETEFTRALLDAKWRLL